MSKMFWNNGFMTEALNAVINYLLIEVGLNRIQASHQLQNIASGRVMQKCNMQFEGIVRQGSIDNKGNLCDIATYSILKSDLKYIITH